MNRTLVTLVVVLVLLVLAWLGLRTLSWRLQYLVPGFGLGLIAGIALTLWATRRRRRDPI